MMVRLFRVCYGMQAPDDRDDYAHRRIALASSLMTLLFRKNFTTWRRRLASQIRRELDNGAQFVNIKQMLRQHRLHHRGALDRQLHHAARRQPVRRGGAGALADEFAGAAATRSEQQPGEQDGRASSRGYSTFVLRRGVPVTPPRASAGCGTAPTWPGSGPGTRSTCWWTPRPGWSTPPPRPRRSARWPGGAGVRQRPADRAHRGGRKPRRLNGSARSGHERPAPGRLDLPRRPGGGAGRRRIHINGDSGALWWPLLRVSELLRLRTLLDTVTTEDGLWDALLAAGVVDIVNKDVEAAYVRVAMDRSSRDPPAPSGRGDPPEPGLQPLHRPRLLIEFNQAPRITYQAAMGKQAIGRALGSQRLRVDTAVHAGAAAAGHHHDRRHHARRRGQRPEPGGRIMCAGGYNIGTRSSSTAARSSSGCSGAPCSAPSATP